MVIADIDISGVLGYDFLYENAASIISQDGSLVLNGDMIQCELESELPSVFRVTLSEIVMIPPNSEIIVQGKINDKLNNLTHAKVEPTSSQLSNRGILIAKPLVDVHTGELLLHLATRQMTLRRYILVRLQQNANQLRSLQMIMRVPPKTIDG